MEGRPWLQYDEEKCIMKCTYCFEYYGSGGAAHNNNLKGQNTFIYGSTNFKITSINDHGASSSHVKAVDWHNAKKSTTEIIDQTPAGKSIKLLSASQRNKMTYLFRNAHAVIKNNRPLRDYIWVCDLQKASGHIIGETYQNGKAALNFIRTIADLERKKTSDSVKHGNFFSFLMDGSTDIAGDEQEVVYVRTSEQGLVKERLLAIGTPESTSVAHLKDFIIQVFKDCDIDTGKLVAVGSDGASNMVGSKGGLVTLLKREINTELVGVHCFAHRLELSFRDVLKKNKYYDKLMIGLYYFYYKSYKNKKGLLDSMKALKVDGVLPQKVIGTRWLPHLSRELDGLFRTYAAYEAHLSSCSHEKAKAGGLAKLLLRKDIVCFALILKDILDPLQKLSKKLQKPESTLADSLIWVESSIDILLECKNKHSTELSGVLQSGKYKDTELKGCTPSINYKDSMIDSLIKAIRDRFQLNDNLPAALHATTLLSFKKWPKSGSSEIEDFGVNEIRNVTAHFKETLSRATADFSEEETLSQFRMFKRVLYNRQKSSVQSLTWEEAYDDEFPLVMLLISLLQCIPLTSVACETTFSQMKLIKTSRRTRMSNANLNDLLTVKLLSSSIQEFDPTESVDKWQADSIQGRRPGYRRTNQRVNIAATDTTAELFGAMTETETEEVDQEEEAQLAFDLASDSLHKDLDCDSDFFEGFLTEDMAWDNVFSFARD